MKKKKSWLQNKIQIQPPLRTLHWGRERSEAERYWIWNAERLGYVYCKACPHHPATSILLLLITIKML